MEGSREKIHIMGIRGSGASYVAVLAKAYGYDVEGSDQSPNSEFTNELNKLNIQIYNDFKEEYLTGLSKLLYSPAVIESGEGGSLIKAAHQRGIETLSWQQFVGRFLLKDKFVIGITGTNGKSTTTAMVGLILEAAGLDPAVALGAKIPLWERNYRIGHGRYFVIEADDAYRSFLNYPSNLMVITNILFDHPEFYTSRSDYQKAFEEFVSISKTDSVLITGSNTQISNPNGRTIKLANYQKFDLKIPGELNQENANLAFAVSQSLGIEPEIARRTLANFPGLTRRFEYKGQLGKTRVYEDYAHHPDAITKTLSAARDIFPDKKIMVVFQPHLYSRTKALFTDFVNAFKNSSVDRLLLTAVYAAREKDDLGVDLMQMSVEIGPKSSFIADLEHVVKTVKEIKEDFDILIVMGAGNINSIIPRVLNNHE